MAEEIEVDGDQGDFLSNILKPGSSLHPTFLLCVDIVIAILLLTLLGCTIVTHGNIHFILLSFVTVGLWGSIKWYLHPNETAFHC